MKRTAWIAIAVAAVAGISVLLRRGIVSVGNPDPLAAQTGWSAAIFDIAVLVLREGLECILVLAAVTAGLTGDHERYRRPVAVGAGIGFLATLVSWCIAVRILDDISNKVSALQLQAATGLLAVVVLLVVMNCFFTRCTGRDGSRFTIGGNTSCWDTVTRISLPANWRSAWASSDFRRSIGRVWKCTVPAKLPPASWKRAVPEQQCVRGCKEGYFARQNTPVPCRSSDNAIHQK